jgi:glycine oxidase
VPAARLLRDGDRIVGARSAQYECRAFHTVLAGGAWSALLDESCAHLAPVYPVRGQIVLLQMDPLPFRHVVERGKCYIIPRPDGHILIGATEEHESGFRPDNTADGVRDLLTRATGLVPGLSEARLVRTWAGLRPGTPDRRPVIGTHDSAPGLVFACGHFRSGLILAPTTAEIVHDIVVHGATGRDLALCAPGRDFERKSR